MKHDQLLASTVTDQSMLTGLTSSRSILVRPKPSLGLLTFGGWVVAGLYRLVERRFGLLLAAGCAALVLSLPAPDPFIFGNEVITLSYQGQAMLALLAGMLVLFITEALPLGALIAIVYAWLLFFHVLTKQEAAAAFSTDAVWFLVGALMIAQVIVKHNLHKHLLALMLRLIGTNIRTISFSLIMFGALASAFMSDSTVAAILLPVGLAIVQAVGGSGKHPQLAKLLMFSIAFGAGTGGLGTPSGGGRNVLIMGFLDQSFGIQMSYGGWVAMAMPVLLVLVPLIWLWLTFVFKPEITDVKVALEPLRAEVKKSSLGVSGWATLLIFGSILVSWILFSSIGIGMLSMVGATVFIVVGLADWRDYQKINWGIVLLYFAAIGFGSALWTSGAATWLAAALLDFIGGLVAIDSVFKASALVVVLISVFTQFMAEAPTVATFGPAMLEMARITGFDPIVLGVPVAMSAAFSYLIAVASPPNEIVYSSGYLNAKDFLKAGVGAMALALVVMLGAVQFWWPLLGVGVDGFH